MVFMTNRRTHTFQGMCSCAELQLAADFSPSIVRLQKRESLFGLALVLDAFGGVVATDSLAGDAGGLPFVVVPDAAWSANWLWGRSMRVCHSAGVPVK